MRQFLEPQLVNGPFGDPGLYIDLRDERRALLFDLGDLAALPPRKLLRLSHVFVSHTHVDHFVGFDQLLRVVLGRKDRIALLGGPDFVAQVEHKLRAYTWNVVQRYAVELVLEVSEHRPDGRGLRARFSSRTGFARGPGEAFDCSDGVLLDEALFSVRGRFLDHGMPCLAFAVEEKARPRVAKNRLAAAGLGTGPWLRELKHAILSGAPAQTPVRPHWRDRLGEHQATRSVAELRELLLDFIPGRRIGYVTDLCFSDANLHALTQLLGGVDLLFIESAFVEADRAHAQRKHHLTAQQAGRIARELGARAVTPFHFSPRYLAGSVDVAAEVHAAWVGSRAVPDATGCNAGGASASPGAWTRAML